MLWTPLWVSPMKHVNEVDHLPMLWYMHAKTGLPTCCDLQMYRAITTSISYSRFSGNIISSLGSKGIGVWAVYALVSSYYPKGKGMYLFNDLHGLWLTFYIERFWGDDLNSRTLLDSAAECHVVLPSQIHDILLRFFDVLRSYNSFVVLEISCLLWF